MHVPLRTRLLAIALLASYPDTARAGMPSVTLTDVARLRVQAISFFFAALLLSAWLMQRLWNYLGRDFTWMPRLNYRKALGVVVLWGLLFVLVLTMISGARELMTPGAWDKQGVTYRLRQEPAPPPEDPRETRRKHQLETLRAALWDYALAHQGKYPGNPSATAIPTETWQLPDGSGMRYVYVGNQAKAGTVKPLAYEPDVYGPQRLVLFTDGTIRKMDIDTVLKAKGAGAE